VLEIRRHVKGSWKSFNEFVPTWVVINWRKNYIINLYIFWEAVQPFILLIVYLLTLLVPQNMLGQTIWW
jgi:hypothetical protein